MPQGTGFGRLYRAETVIGLILLTVGGVMFLSIRALPDMTSYGVGPRLVPEVVAIGIMLLGVAHFFARGRRPELEEGAIASLLRPALILAALLVAIVLLELGAGFIASAAVVFAVTAYVFGRRAMLSNLVIGFVVATIVYAVLGLGLTLALPQGPLELLLNRLAGAF